MPIPSVIHTRRHAMNRTVRNMSLALVLLSIASAATALAQTLRWHTIDSGGTTFATAGNYEVSTTIGQPDAGVMSGESFMLKT